MIGLLIDKQVPYTEAEAEALVVRAKARARESGRTVRAEAELLVSGDRGTRLGDLREKVAGAGELLGAIAVDVEALRSDAGDDDGELAAIMATMAAACAPFTRGPAGDATSTRHHEEERP